MTAMEYNQFVKGKAFVLTDCLMTSSNPYSKEEIELILEYSAAFIKFSCQWLQNFPSLYTNVILFQNRLVH